MKTWTPGDQTPPPNPLKTVQLVKYQLSEVGSICGTGEFWASLEELTDGKSGDTENDELAHVKWGEYQRDQDWLNEWRTDSTDCDAH